MNPLLALLPLLVADPSGDSDARLPAEVRDVAPLLAPIRERHELPALAGAIVTTDGLIALGAVGLRSAADAEPVGEDDLWHLGSCTKAMTATLVARLVEKELLTWDTTPGDVFGDSVEGMDPAWREVPIRLLVSNRAGAPADLKRDGLWMRLRLHKGTPREQRRTLVEGVLAEPPEVEPGTAYLYSNAGFALAGAMLETLADEPWEELLRREVFEPLGMAGAGFGVPGSAEALDQPRGHFRRRDGLRPVTPGPAADNPAAIGPAGTVHASLRDWARFAQAHLRGDDAFLRPETWERLHTSLEGQEYGNGWAVVERPWAGGPALAHSGSNTMWYCTIWLAPRKGFGVLVATNVGDDAAAKACDEAAGALIAAAAAASPSER